MGHQTFFLQNADEIILKIQPNENDAISVKKCLMEISQVQSVAIREQSDKKYIVTPLKRIAKLLAKLMELYPTVATPLIM